MSEETKPKVDETTEKNEQETTDEIEKEESTGEEEITISKEELEKLQNKAKDFDGIVEKQRIMKLKKKQEVKVEDKAEDGTETAKADEESISEIVKTQVASLLRESTATIANQNLEGAYKKFMENNKWADSDEVINSIGSKLELGNAVTEEEILSKIKIAAQTSHPSEYEKAIEDSIKTKLMAEKQTVAEGEGAGGADGEAKKFIDKGAANATAEDKRIADRFFGGDIARYLKSKK